MSNELRRYRSARQALIVARRLQAVYGAGGCKLSTDGHACLFTVEEHPYASGWGIKRTDQIGRIAWVCQGKLPNVAVNARGVA